MRKLLLFFVLWVAGSYAVYSFLPRWAIVAYGVLTLAGLLIWAATRPAGLNDKAGPQ